MFHESRIVKRDVPRISDSGECSSNQRFEAHPESEIGGSCREFEFAVEKRRKLVQEGTDAKIL